VTALVLVDSLYPRMVKKAQDFPLMTRIAGQLAFSRSVWREIETIDETGEMVLGLSGIDDKPIVRPVNQPTSSTAIAVDFGAFRMDDATRDAVRALYPKDGGGGLQPPDGADVPGNRHGGDSAGPAVPARKSLRRTVRARRGDAA